MYAILRTFETNLLAAGWIRFSILFFLLLTTSGLFAKSSSMSSLIHKHDSTEADSKFIWKEDYSEAIDMEVRRQMVLTHTPGAALAIIHNGKVVKKEYYGLADVENGEKVNADSEFWLASITKSITCTLVLDMAEDGLLSLNDPITKYLPELPESFSEVRIRHLMSHTSGLADYTQMEEHNRIYNALYEGQGTADDFEDLLASSRLYFTPGSRYEYGDLALGTLAVVASRAGGKLFHKLMEERIFEVSGMNSYLSNSKEQHPEQVKGYTWKKWELKPDSNREWLKGDRRAYGGAGSLFVTLNDMIAFNRALNENIILNEMSRELLWKKFQLDNGKQIPQGLGMKNKDLPGGTIMGHDGIAGTHYWKMPEYNLDIILLTNHGSNLAPNGILGGVAGKIGLLDKLGPEMVLSQLGLEAALPGSVSMEGKYKFVMPPYPEMYFEFYEEEGNSMLILQGIELQLIPLQDGSVFGYTPAAFFPGLPGIFNAMRFKKTPDGLVWLFPNAEMPLEKIE